MKIKECPEHGPYRGDVCPVCGVDGKFLLTEWEANSISKFMSGLLRHFPEKFELPMDEHGWVEIYDLVGVIRGRFRKFYWLRRHHIIALVMTDEKGRYQLDEEKKRMRSTYGHSIDVDLSDLPQDDIPETLYYPTTPEELDIILEAGIRPSDRKWVHLSRTYEDAYEAGSHRVENPIILEVTTDKVLTAGEAIYRASHRVYITKLVTPDSLKVVQKNLDGE